MNIIFLIGNVGKDPEIRSTNSGSQVANFSLATTERWRNKDGEKQEKTNWHDCVVWGSLTKVVEDWVEKGSKIAVVGRLEKRSWEDNDGNKRWATEVNVDRLELLGVPGGAGPKKARDEEDEEDDDDRDTRPRKAKTKSPPKRRPKSSGDDLDDDIPF